MEQKELIDVYVKTLEFTNQDLQRMYDISNTIMKAVKGNNIDRYPIFYEGKIIKPSSLKSGIADNKKRIECLVKMQMNEPVTEEEKSRLMTVPVLANDCFIKEYTTVEKLAAEKSKKEQPTVRSSQSKTKQHRDRQRESCKKYEKYLKGPQ